MSDALEYPFGVLVEELNAELDRLRAEVALLRNQEALKDIALGEVRRLKDELNTERMKYARLHDQLEEMNMDLSLMEDQISELSGRKGIVPDYE